jgi:hypothetical protein
MPQFSRLPGLSFAFNALYARLPADRRGPPTKLRRPLCTARHGFLISAGRSN